MQERPTQKIILLRHLLPESDKKTIDPEFNVVHLTNISAAILSTVPELVSGFDVLLSSPSERCVNSSYIINEYLKNQNLYIDLTNIQGVTTSNQFGESLDTEFDEISELKTLLQNVVDTSINQSILIVAHHTRFNITGGLCANLISVMLDRNLSDTDRNKVRNTCPTSPNYASGLIYTFANGEYNLEAINTGPKIVY